jgi:hypothetical protein
MRNGRGDGGGPSAGHRETVERVKMEKMALEISAIDAAYNQENTCSTLNSVVSYARLLTTFVDGLGRPVFFEHVLMVQKRGEGMRQYSTGFAVVITAVVITVGGYSQRALAAASYSAYAQAAGFPGGPVSATFSAPIPISEEYSGPAGDHAPGGPYGTLTTIGVANPEPGILGTMGSVQLNNAYFGIGGASLNGTGNASFTFDDLFVSGPSSPGTVPITFNLVISGSYSTSISQNNADVVGFGGNCDSLVTVGVGVGINGINFSGNLNDESILQGSGAITQSYSDSGLLAGTGGSGTIPVSLSVPVNSPFSFGAYLNTTAAFQIDINGTEGEEPNMNASAVVDYTDPFEFAPQAATLPDGYYLNSVEAGIVNDTFTPLPEPGTISLIAIGGLGLLRRVRRPD